MEVGPGSTCTSLFGIGLHFAYPLPAQTRPDLLRPDQVRHRKFFESVHKWCAQSLNVRPTKVLKFGAKVKLVDIQFDRYRSMLFSSSTRGCDQLASTMAKFMFTLGLVLAAVMVHTAFASDPHLTTDFNVTNPTVEDFTSSAFRASNVQPLGQGKAAPTPAVIPGLSGLGLTPVLFEFGPESQIDPHTHPRATELFFVLSGCVDVGFVDTNNDLFETTVQTGDLFVFPKGLLHWQRNNGNSPASGFSALSSENPGTLLVVEALFTASGKGLPDIVLATAFGTNTQEIDSLRGPIAVRNNVTLSW